MQQLPMSDFEKQKIFFKLVEMKSGYGKLCQFIFIFLKYRKDFLFKDSCTNTFPE